MSQVLTTLVVEDEPAARDKLVGLLLHEADLNIVADVGDISSARAAIAIHRIQLAFLDIQIGDGSGLDLAAELGRDASVVFVTAYDAHAVRAFDLNAVDYLLKPYTSVRLLETLNRVRARLQGSARPSMSADGGHRTPLVQNNLLLKAGNRLVSARIADIAWVESDDNYLKLHGQRVFHERITLHEFLERYGGQFLRIHRSLAVNLDHVEGLRRVPGLDPVLCLKGGQELRVGRSFAADIYLRLPRLR